MTELTAPQQRDLLKDIVHEGSIGVARDYYMRLAAGGDEVSIDDLRKALELGSKIMGVAQPERLDNLLTVNWVINATGGITVDATKPALDLIEDVTPKAIASEAPEEPTELSTPPATPEQALASTFAVVDNLLDSL